MTIVIGIDPGKKGGLVALDNDGLPTVMLPLEDGLDWLLALNAGDPAGGWHAFVEKASARPGQGVTSMFTFGVGFGRILGVLQAIKMPHTLVPAATWTRVCHAGCAAGEPKARSLEAARRLFPGETWKQGRQTKPQDGLVDAALIAHYGWRQLCGAKGGAA